MRNVYIRLFMLFSSLMMAAACVDYDVEEILLVRDNVSLTIKGNVQFEYASMTCQLGYSPERCEFRAYDDMLGNWFVLKCYADPAEEGMTVKGDLEYTTFDSKVNLTGLRFVVKKTDWEGYVWLWNDERKIGAVVKKLGY